jgi:hypothetical protein
MAMTLAIAAFPRAALDHSVGSWCAYFSTLDLPAAVDARRSGLSESNEVHCTALAAVNRPSFVVLAYAKIPRRTSRSMPRVCANGCHCALPCRNDVSGKNLSELLAPAFACAYTRVRVCVRVCVRASQHRSQHSAASHSGPSTRPVNEVMDL